MTEDDGLIPGWLTIRWLVLLTERVTVWRQVNHLGHQLSRSTQPSIPPG